MTEGLRLTLLGRLQVMLAGSPLRLGTAKAEALLYYLAVNQQPHSRERLVDLLWSDMPSAKAKRNLTTTLSALRKSLAPYLHIEPQTIAFNRQAPHHLDVTLFQAHIQANREVEDMTRLQQAVDLYQGDFLAGLYVKNAYVFEEWVLTERERLRELMLQTLDRLISGYLDRADYPLGLDYAARLLTLDPWRESAYRQMMILLANSGQRSAALAQYKTCRQVLADELGVEPSPETTRLYERLIGDRLPISHNLPGQQINDFVGRIKELSQASTNLSDPACRLLSVVGPGGMGKTRLALEIARRQIQPEQSLLGTTFTDGVYFIDLTALTLPEPVKATPRSNQLANDLATAIAKALDLSFQGSADLLSQLQTYLRDKTMLLILDNFEQLAPEAELLSHFLQATPNLKMIVTSRERLNLVEEWVLSIEGLDFPPVPSPSLTAQTLIPSELETYGAVALFVQRARQIQADFTLSKAEAQSVLRICRLVEGIPLALVLAASWLSVLSCAEIAAEIERSLDFLQSSLRNIPARHRSVRAVFEQTWQRLSENEQAVLSQLSVFKGGCEREAAEVVVGASLRILAALVGKALLRRMESGRYKMHELLRQFAAEKLQDTFSHTETTLTAHAQYYGDFLQKRERDLKGGRQLEALREIAADVDNAWASWRWAVEHRDLELIQRALESFYLFFEMQGQAQVGISAFEQAVAALRDPTLTPKSPMEKVYNLVWGQLIGRQGFLANRLGDFEPSLDMMRESVSCLRQAGTAAQAELALSLHHLGQEIYIKGEYAEAKQLMQESLTLAEAVDDEWVLGQVWLVLGETAEFQGEYLQAEPFFRKSIDNLARLGEQRIKAFALNNWGRAAYAMGNYSQARQLIEEALQIRQTFGDLIGLVYSRLDLGKLALLEGQLLEADQQIRRALAISEEIGERDQTARCLNGLGILFRLQGDLIQAEESHQTGLTIYQELGSKRGIPFTLSNLGCVVYEQGDFQQAEQHFLESLKVSQAFDNSGERASALRHLGHVASALSHDADARRYYQQALEIVVRTGAAPVALDIFLGWALHLSCSGQPNAVDQQAVELLTLVQHHSATTYETRQKARQYFEMHPPPAKGAPELLTETQSETQDRPFAWKSIAKQLIDRLPD